MYLSIVPGVIALLVPITVVLLISIIKPPSVTFSLALTKGTLENKHIELHYILPKRTDLKALGLSGQEALNLLLSHVNSSLRESLGGRSPLELTRFMYPDLYEKPYAFRIKMIPKDQVILKPYLLKK